MAKISEHLSELVELGAERSVTIYDPDKGLKTIAVAEAGERHWARAWRETKDPFAREQLEKAIKIKIDEQVKYLVWRNEAVESSQKAASSGRKGISRISALKSYLPAADPGDLVIHRWNTRFCSKPDKRSKWISDPDKIVSRQNVAKHRATRICEQQNDGTVRGTEGTGEIERYTPAIYIEATRRVLGEIDLDPASCDLAQQTVDATDYFTIEDDGLSQEWRGRIWLNPPYHKKLLPAFISKLVAEIASGRITAAIMLTNNSTDTEWFNTAVGVCQSICFTRGRIQFHPAEIVGAPTQGQAFFYFGNDVQRFEDVFCVIGLCLRPSRLYEPLPEEKNEEEQDGDET
jgi:ParB family chromosome partitioning protein